jgi:glutamate racemase
VNIIETAAPVTLQLSKQLIEKNISTSSTQPGQHQFFSSQVTTQQERIFSQLWNKPIMLEEAP